MEERETSNKKKILFLLFLAPIMGEVLSGSTPLFEFFHPLVLMLLLGLYGVGALLFRELIVRWNKGYASLLIAGLAYGILEEGIILKSFFNPGWVDVGVLGVYGRFLDVNWIWVAMLMIFHSLISISTPVMLTDLVFPEIRGKSLLSDGLIKVLIVVLAIDGFLFNIMTPYQPSILHYIVFAGLMVVLLHIAKKYPENYGTNESIKGPILISMFMVWAFILLVPHLLRVLGMPALFDFLILIALFVWFFLEFQKYDMNNITNVYGFAAGITFGVASYAILADVILSLQFIGCSIVGIIFIIWMIHLKKNLNI